MRALCLSVCIGCFIAVAASADDVDVKGLAERADAQRRNDIKSLYHQREDIRTRKGLKPSERRDQIEKLNRRIVELADPGKTAQPKSVDPLHAQVGTVVELSDKMPIGLFDTIDKDNMVVSLTHDEAVPGVTQRGFSAAEAGSIQAYRATHRPAAPIETYKDAKLLWVRGVPTKGIKVNRGPKLNGTFAITGTENYTYDSDNGPVTEALPVLQPVNLTSQKDKSAQQENLRSWTMRDGRKIDAYLMLYDLGIVTLRSPEGKDSTSKLADFSDADRDYLTENTLAPTRIKSGK